MYSFTPSRTLPWQGLAMQHQRKVNTLVEGVDAYHWDTLGAMHHLDIQAQEVNVGDIKHLQDETQRHAGDQLSLRRQLMTLLAEPLLLVVRGHELLCSAQCL